MRKDSHINIGLILLPIIILLLADNGFLYSNIYLLVYILILFITSISSKKYKSISFLTIAIILITSLQIQNISSRDYLSCFFLLIVAFLAENNRLIKPNTTFFKIGKIIFVLTIATFILYLSDNSNFSNHEHRFESWSDSPTTMAFYSLFLAYIYSLYIKKAYYKDLLFIFIFFTVLYSGTRSGLILVFIVYLCSRLNFLAKLLSKKYISTLIIVLVILLSVFNDAIYSVFVDLGINEYLGRYQGDSDYSYLTRLSLKLEQFNIISSSTITEFLFGHGAGYTVETITKISSSDSTVLPHNDFIKLFIDWGLIFSVIFVCYIIKFFNKLKQPFIPLLIYVSSFSHNMIFDHFNIILLASSFIVLKSIENNK